MKDDNILGKVVIPFSSLYSDSGDGDSSGGSSSRTKRVLNLVSQSGIKKLKTNHIRGPSAFYRYQMDFNNDKAEDFP